MLKRLQKNLTETIFLSFFVLLFIAFAWFMVHTFDLTDVHKLATFIVGWGKLGPLALILLSIIAAITGVIPSYPLTLLAGGIWGFMEGSIYMLIGTQIGAVLAFWITRSAAFPWVEELLGKHVRVYRVIDEKKLTGFIFLSRLLPFFVFELISYGAGLTRIKFWHYFWATFLGIIPMTLFLAWSGKTAIAEGGPLLLIITLLSVVLLFIFPYVVEKYNIFGLRDKLIVQEESQEDAS